MISPETLPSRMFQPRRYGLGAWTEHIFFAYDLVAALRPSRLVELGTDRGESYFAFCQSVEENNVSTECFAIDHWQGDHHAGSYENATYVDVEAHNRAHYAHFSTLVRSSFDEALPSFAPESIDLLHIDGDHAEEAVRHDVESWLPKLRPGGILLMHDIAVRTRGFGVWKVWGELLARGRGFAFDSPPGLGVWEKPPAPFQPALLETLFAAPNELRSYYRERIRALQEQMMRQWQDGSIRTAPMATETVIQLFWSNDGVFSEEQSVDARIGHGNWKEVSLSLPDDREVSQLRIDFFSALTVVEIASVEVNHREIDLESVLLGGDCARLSLNPFRLQITGIDPQLYLPPLSTPLPNGRKEIRLRLRVEPCSLAR